MQSVYISKAIPGTYTWGLCYGDHLLHEGDPESSIQACLEAASRCLLDDEPLVSLSYQSIPFGAFPAIRLQDDPPGLADEIFEKYRYLCAFMG